MTIEISPLRLDEAEALAELARVVWHAHYPGIIDQGQIDYMLAQRYQPGLIKQLLARGDLWLAARIDGELVGFGHGYPTGDGDYKLDKLYVHPDRQRQGIGGALIQAIADRARRRGHSRLLLRVNRQNQQAIDAYLKHGFTVATIVVEEIGNGYLMDDYVMIKELT